jgi:hypothetical protein
VTPAYTDITLGHAAATYRRWVRRPSDVPVPVNIEIDPVYDLAERTQIKRLALDVERSIQSYYRVRLLDLVADVYMSPSLVGWLGVFLRSGNPDGGGARVPQDLRDPESFGEFQRGLKRYFDTYLDLARGLPDLPLAQRKGMVGTPAFGDLYQRAFHVRDILGWLLILMGMEAQVTGARPYPLSRLPEHRRADALRHWCFNQTPAGKTSIAKMNKRAQTKRRGALHAP